MCCQDMEGVPPLVGSRVTAALSSSDEGAKKALESLGSSTYALQHILSMYVILIDRRRAGESWRWNNNFTIK